MANESKIPNRSNWYIKDGTVTTDLQLDALVDMYIGYMYDRTYKMFEYQNLPDGITNKDMERFTQVNGKQFFIKLGDRHYILEGSFVDYITWNKEPKEALIVNPALPNLKNKYEIGKDCVLFPNDSNYIGLYPMMLTNAIQMAHVDISLMFASFNTRFKSLFTANDDNSKDSINTAIDNIWNGKKPSAVMTEDLYKKSVESVNYNTSQQNDIVSLIELKQYIKANWYIDLGINANYNMKREALNESEMQVNDDALIPLIDDMFECRKKAVEEINSMFGLEITVDYSSAWKKIKEEIENKIELEEAEVETVENQVEESTEEPKEEGDEDDKNS